MFSEEEKIIQLLDNFTANDYGEFLLDNATKDFLFIRPSGNPIDASGFIKMKTSGDLSCDGYTDIKKIRKLEFLSDNVAMCIFTLRSSFVYKDIQNTDLATVTAIIKKINNQWKFSWMHRSSGDSDLSIWDLYAHTLNGNKKD
tara:strand:+ start:106 stop:534 length:429 start_codon:yes stop_codon:yes gene_type:complete